MQYDWERKKALRLFMEKVESLVPDGYAVVGIAIANMETVEAAMIVGQTEKTLGEMGAVDIWLDIYGDAEMHYCGALEKLEERFSGL